MSTILYNQSGEKELHDALEVQRLLDAGYTLKPKEKAKPKKAKPDGKN